MKRKVLYSFLLCLLLFYCHFFLMGCTEKDELLSLVDQQSDSGEKKEELNRIKVHITGEVKRRGVYTMPKDARVEDVVEAAGGFTIDADVDVVNLAEFIKDGQKIHIPKVGEKVQSVSEEHLIVDLNLGTKEELMKLPKVGEKLASAIIAYRETHEFIDFQDLLNVDGIGEKRLESFKGKISIGGTVYE
ncbi:MAG: ComEA family DNA-binding protein [Tissierellia bacterium]|nr:ComEA family DNA-binding protein [Tissierellia bacterium]